MQNIGLLDVLGHCWQEVHICLTTTTPGHRQGSYQLKNALQTHNLKLRVIIGMHTSLIKRGVGLLAFPGHQHPQNFPALSTDS
eukprot:604418-Pelagomonas_calceolata.AAC.1